MSDETRLIVVGVDGSEESGLAVQWAIGEARRTGADIRAVLVWDDPWSLGGGPTPLSAAGPELQRLRQVLEVTTRQAFEAVPGPTVVVETEVHSGHASEVLAKQAGDADMLVVASHGRSGLAGRLLGSVSQRLAQTCSVPLVIVPARR